MSLFLLLSGAGLLLAHGALSLVLMVLGARREAQRLREEELAVEADGLLQAVRELRRRAGFPQGLRNAVAALAGTVDPSEIRRLAPQLVCRLLRARGARPSDQETEWAARAVGGVLALGETSRRDRLAKALEFARGRGAVPEQAILELTLAPDESLLPGLLVLAEGAEPGCRAAALTAVALNPVTYGGAWSVVARLVEQGCGEAMDLSAWALRELAIAHPALLPELEARSAAEPRRVAVEAAGRVLARRSAAEERSLARAVLERGCASRVEAIRARAITALSPGCPDSVLRLGQTLLMDPEPNVVRAAARALSALEGPAGAEELVSALARAPEQIEPILLAALERAREHPVGLWLEQCRTSRSIRARVTWLKALGASGVNVEAEDLVPFLSDADREVRRSAAAALTRLGRARGAQALTGSVQAALVARLDTETCEAAVAEVVGALAVVGDSRAAPHLLRAVSRATGPLAARMTNALALLSLRARSAA